MGVGETGVGETGVGEHVLIPGHCCFIRWFIMYAAEGTKIGGHMTACVSMHHLGESVGSSRGFFLTRYLEIAFEAICGPKVATYVV